MRCGVRSLRAPLGITTIRAHSGARDRRHHRDLPRRRGRDPPPAPIARKTSTRRAAAKPRPRALLWQHVRAHALGQVWTEVGFRLAHDPDTVRAPDIAFVRADRLPMPDASGFYRGAPDLAIEVLSPGDPVSDVRDTVRDYFAAGTPIVVVVDPAARRVTVHKPDTTPRVHREADTLDLDPLVSGFSVSVTSLFE